MSVPARRLPDPHHPGSDPRSAATGRRSTPPHPRPDRAARPARPPAARPNPATPPQRRARRGSTPAFWLFASLLVAGLVMAVVALNALVVNTTYRMTEVEQRVRSLQEGHGELDIEVARLSSPSRISAWASTVGMVVPGPGESVILRVAGDWSER